MNELKPVLRLLVLVQIFLLFLAILMPALLRLLQEPIGKIAYVLVALFCIFQALLLRRALTKLE